MGFFRVDVAERNRGLSWVLKVKNIDIDYFIK